MKTLWKIKSWPSFSADKASLHNINMMLHKKLGRNHLAGGTKMKHWECETSKSAHTHPDKTQQHTTNHVSNHTRAHACILAWIKLFKSCQKEQNTHSKTTRCCKIKQRTTKMKSKLVVRRPTDRRLCPTFTVTQWVWPRNCDTSWLGVYLLSGQHE